MSTIQMTDRRGKIMVDGGRYRTAQHVRFLRRHGAGNAAAWMYIRSARRAYAPQQTVPQGLPEAPF